MKTKTVLIYSGGLDSTVLLFELVKVQEREVFALSINYGQRHHRELHAAKQIAKGFDPYDRVTHKVIDLPQLSGVMLGSSQTDQNVAVPHGHYAEESMKKTIVPNRNMILLAIAGAYAISLKAEEIAYAAHAGDHAIYPDCRPEFAEAMETALSLADWHQPRLIRPFINMTKADIVKRGQELGVPMGRTWSCYDPQTISVDDPNACRMIHCGECGTCSERRESFQLAGVQDPTQYAK